jgi:competence protein ComEC
VTYRIAPPSAWVVAMYYAATSAAWIVWRHRIALGTAAESDLAARLFRRWRAASALAVRRRLGRTILRMAAGMAAASGLWILTDPRRLMTTRGDGRLHVTFIDVGQGDASMVRFPRGGTLLVDAGGAGFASSFDIGDRVVAPVIRDAGFYRLDRVALTHGDPDHIGGAGSVIEEFRPREVWEGIPVQRSGPLTALRTETLAAAGRWANVYAGDRVSVDGVDVLAWHPARGDWERQKVRNDDSLVLELRWRDVSMLLTGDIGRSVEGALGATIPAAPLRVVKVPHHGSLTSSTREFVTAIRPRVAVVSAGRANHFGHPAPEVLERYRAAGAEIFRTDRDGAITVDSDGTSIEVHTFSGRRFAIQ